MVDGEIYLGKYVDERFEEVVTNISKMFEELVNITTQKDFKNIKISVIRPYVSTSGKIDDRVILVLNDEKNTFWPCIIRLTEDQAEKLSNILLAARYHIKKEQFSKDVE